MTGMRYPRKLSYYFQYRIMTLNSFVRLNRISNNIWHLLLNRPSYHNAFNTELAYELIAHCHEINTSSDIGAVVVVSGQGRSFCSGADLKERRSLTSSKQWMEQHHIFERMFNSLAQLKQPTIACVEGFALGRIINYYQDQLIFY